MIIAIDGPAASGKGTLGKRLARHYGYRHLDTGVIYRAVAKALLDAGLLHGDCLTVTGKTLAVNGLGTIPHVGARAWVDQNGGNSKTLHFFELPAAAVEAGVIEIEIRLNADRVGV